MILRGAAARRGTRNRSLGVRSDKDGWSMRGIDLGIVVALLGAVAGGTAYIVKLEGRVGELSRRLADARPSIQRATDEAIATIQDFGEGLQHLQISRRYSTGGSSGTSNQRLISGDDGFCFLARVAGDLNGNGEWAQVRLEENGFWNLQTDSRSGSGRGAWVYADAYCILYPKPEPAP